MAKHHYLFANYIFEIDSIYPFFYEYAKEYEVNETKSDYQITIKEEDINKWKQDHKDNLIPEHEELLVIQTRVADILASNHTFIFHGSAIYLDSIDNGYIFTGPSGVGKSTHVNLLKDIYKDRLVIINDDKPFIDKDYNIYGSPWSGKSHLSTNTKSRLKGIFVLYQDKVNKIEELASSEALNYLIKQIYIPKGMNETNIGLDFLINLVKDIPIYRVGLDLDKDAYKITSKIMLGETDED